MKVYVKLFENSQFMGINLHTRQPERTYGTRTWRLAPAVVGGYVFIRRGGGVGEGVGSGYLRNFLRKKNGLMYDSSQIPTQKHLILPPPPPRQI